MRLDAAGLVGTAQRLGARHGHGPMAVLLAGYQVLLARLSGQERFAVGVTVSRSDRPAAGSAARTRVVPGDLAGDPAFAAVLERVAVALDGGTGPRDGSDAGRLPAVLFGWNEDDAGPRRQASVAEGAETASLRRFAVELAVDIRPEPHGFGLAVTYRTELFDEATVRRWTGWLQRLLEAAADDPAAPISRLPMMSAAEQAGLIALGTAPAVSEPATGVADSVAQWAVSRPDQIAVDHAESRLTYAELDRRVERLAHHLQHRGVGPETRVAVALPRGPELVVALLAVLRAGGAYVPIDPAYPSDRIEYIRQQSRATLCITTSGSADRYGGARVVLDPHTVFADPDGPLRRDVQPDCLAYVIYTSGSTGRPKGVMVTRRALLNLLGHFVAELVGEEPVRLLSVTTFSFDIAALELFLPLMVGGTVVLADELAAADPVALTSLVLERDITMLQATPATWRMLKDTGCRFSIQAALVGGEPLAEDLAEYIRTLARVGYNGYGPTETTIYSSRWRLSGEPVSIGSPVRGTRMLVLDRHGRLQPVGVPGELCIGGTGVARGYLDRPGGTAERFVPDPYGPPGSVLYRTGDLARARAGGGFDFLGRLDHQVKIRGYRIELGEVEAALRDHPGVRDAVVVPAAGGESLAAYLVGADATAELGADVAPDVDAVREAVRARLPAYMVPASFTILPALPVTPNGKVDRKALPPPDPSGNRRLPSMGAPVGPRSPLEARLCGLVAALLGVSAVGIRDDFFMLGGHSLLVARLLSRIRRDFGAEVPVRSFFRAPTVENLATILDRRGPRDAPAAGISRADRSRPLPVSYVQRQLWFLDQLVPESAAYVVFESLWLHGGVDVDALRRSLAVLVDRHEALRTTFTTVDGEPVQVVLAPDDVPDILEVVCAVGAEKVDGLVRTWLDHPFDLSADAPVRALLVELTDGRRVFSLCVHHIAIDGTSLGVLFAELSACYAAFGAGRAPVLPPVPAQFADFAAWQRNLPVHGDLEEGLAYLTGSLAGAPTVLPLPFDRGRPARQSFRGGVVYDTIDEELTRRLRRLGAPSGATLFAVVLAAFDVLLARLSGQPDIVVGVPVAARNHGDLESIVGFVANTIAMRTRLDGDPTFAALLDRVREQTRSSLAHQDVPFALVVDRLAAQRQLSHNPVFQVMFSLQDAPADRLRLPGIELSRFQTESGGAKFDLSVILYEHAGGALSAVFEYDSALLDRDTVRRWAGYYRHLLSAVADDADRPVSRLPLLSDAEHARVLGLGTGAVAKLPVACVHEMVADRAAAHPDRVAVRHGRRSLTFGELNRKANQLAHRLRGLGVTAETTVAVLMPRSIELVIALLGVLKAGGAYVPVDPSYPAARIAYLREQSRAAVTVTTGALAASQPGTVVALDAGTTFDLPVTDPEVVVDPDNLAYVVYTSGTTGRPKGTMTHHRAIAHLCDWLKRFFDHGPNDRSTLLANVSFDGLAYEVWPHLAQGCALHVVDDETRIDPSALMEFIRAQRITRCYLPTPLAQVMAEAEWPADSELRVVVTGGDRLHRPDRKQRWRLYNTYGPSETTVLVTHQDVRSGPAGEDPPSVGRAIDNARLYALDGELNLQPPGVPGELYIGGAQLGRGYVGAPAATAERFIPDPFGPPGSVLYRTGDVVRLGTDGRFDFLGRTDEQAKVNGFRVEPAEIESVLREHPQVREAAVVARPGARGQRRLVAYVVGTDGAPDLDALRAHLRRELPGYLVPGWILPLAEFPMTPNGKLDRAGLPPAPDGPDAAPADRPGTGGTDTVEDRVAAAWHAVLGVDRLPADNFFEAGGSSLLLTRLLDGLRQAFGVPLRLVDVFANPTIAAQAGLIRAMRGDTSSALPDEDPPPPARRLRARRAGGGR